MDEGFASGSRDRVGVLEVVVQSSASVPYPIVFSSLGEVGTAVQLLVGDDGIWMVGDGLSGLLCASADCCFSALRAFLFAIVVLSIRKVADWLYRVG